MGSALLPGNNFEAFSFVDTSGGKRGWMTTSLKGYRLSRPLAQLLSFWNHLPVIEVHLIWSDEAL